MFMCILAVVFIMPLILMILQGLLSLFCKSCETEPNPLAYPISDYSEDKLSGYEKSRLYYRKLDQEEAARKKKEEEKITVSGTVTFDNGHKQHIRLENGQMVFCTNWKIDYIHTKEYVH